MLSLIIAHPDDESWAFLSLLLLAESRDWPVRILCLTSGEAGGDMRSTPTSGASLAAVREDELRAAMQHLNTDVSVTFSRLPDSALHAHREAAHAHMAAWWDDETILAATWGPSGGYGHLDHVCCYTLCREFFADRTVPVMTAHFPWPSASALHRSLRKFRRGALVVQDFDSSHAQEQSRVRLPVSALRKREALGEHRTQIGERAVDDFVQPALTRALMRHEHFDLLEWNAFRWDDLRALLPSKAGCGDGAADDDAL